MKILIIEDNLVNLKIMQCTLANLLDISNITFLHADNASDITIGWSTDLNLSNWNNAIKNKFDNLGYA